MGLLSLAISPVGCLDSIKKLLLELPYHQHALHMPLWSTIQRQSSPWASEKGLRNCSCNPWATVIGHISRCTVTYKAEPEMTRSVVRLSLIWVVTYIVTSIIFYVLSIITQSNG